MQIAKYWTGYGLTIAFGVTSMIIAFVLELSYVWGNDKRDKIPEDQVRALYSEDELLRMGSISPLFRYTA